MVSPKWSHLGESSSVPCDFCNDQTAILYCRADSAKLCLLCDHHVHSANALSRKHLRSQICDNCASEPVSVRCATDNLVLCQDCDWDAHATSAVSAAHHRTPIDPFSGCPSALDLASAWGLEIQHKKPPQAPPRNWPPAPATAGAFLDSSWVMSKEVSVSASVLLHDLMVPNHNNPSSAVVFPDCGPDMMRKQASPTCGKQRLVIAKQLMGLLESDMADGGGGEELGPGTPNASGGAGDCCGLWQGNEEVCGVENEGDGVVGIVNQQFQPQQQQQNAPFMSLLMMQTSAIPKERDRTAERNTWNTSACDQPTQVLFLTPVSWSY